MNNIRIELEVKEGRLFVYLVLDDDQGSIVLSESHVSLSSLKE